MNTPAIGELIRRELARQERTVVWFANHLPCDRTNVYRIFAKTSLDTELLFRISIVLGHNFFNDLASTVDQVMSSK
jgi:hypothetical protein